MSKERELLEKWVTRNGFLDYYDIKKETKEFLAQPKALAPEREFIRLWYENIELWKVHAKELLAQPEQEEAPVATKLEGHQFTAFHVSADDFKKLQKLPTGTKIYTAPPKRKAIEDGELEVWYSQHTWAMDKQEYMWGFRDAEKMHGIGGE